MATRRKKPDPVDETGDAGASVEEEPAVVDEDGAYLPDADATPEDAYPADDPYPYEPEPIYAPADVPQRRSAAPSLLVLLIAIVLTAAAAAGGWYVVDQRKPTYFATTATLLDQPVAIAASKDSGVIDKLSRLRFKYAGILHSDAVVLPVAATLGVDRSAVAGNIVSSGDTASTLLLVGARSTDRRFAVRLANELASELTRYIDKEQQDNAIPAAARVALQVVTPARSARQIEPTKRQHYVAAAGAGLAALVLTLGVADLLRRRRR